MPLTFTGPAPSSPLGFCAVCAAQWKSDAIDADKPAIKAADAAPTPTTRRLAPSAAPPAQAVAYALLTMPGPTGTPAQGQPIVVPMPACWTHLAAVKFTSSGLIPAPPGAVLLDGGQHPPR